MRWWGWAKWKLVSNIWQVTSFLQPSGGWVRPVTPHIQVSQTLLFDGPVTIPQRLQVPERPPPYFPKPNSVWGSPCHSKTSRKSTSGTLGSKPEAKPTVFDNGDLQPGVSFLGNTVCHLYEQQLHSIWYLGRQQARADMWKRSITPRSTTPLVINIDVH